MNIGCNKKQADWCKHQSSSHKIFYQQQGISPLIWKSSQPALPKYTMANYKKAQEYYSTEQNFCMRGVRRWWKFKDLYCLQNTESIFLIWMFELWYEICYFLFLHSLGVQFNLSTPEILVIFFSIVFLSGWMN